MSKNEEKTKSHYVETLIGAGKAMAQNILKDAVATAEDKQQMQGQIFVVEIAACHILAQCAWNAADKDDLESPAREEFLDARFAEIKEDLRSIIEEARQSKTKKPQLELKKQRNPSELN